MKGFVKNEGKRPLFILQRSINPGFSISLDEAYIVAGKKSGKKKGPLFVNWLRETYFQDSIWAFYKEDGENYFEEGDLIEAVSSSSAQGAGKNLVRKDDAKEKGEITAQRIIDNDIVIAKQLIDKCKDRNVLKKALAASRHYSGKESHMRYILRRLEQVYF